MNLECGDVTWQGRTNENRLPLPGPLIGTSEISRGRVSDILIARPPGFLELCALEEVAAQYRQGGRFYTLVEVFVSLALWNLMRMTLAPLTGTN
jgi:hypothetical protein